MRCQRGQLPWRVKAATATTMPCASHRSASRIQWSPWEMLSGTCTGSIGTSVLRVATTTTDRSCRKSEKKRPPRGAVPAFKCDPKKGCRPNFESRYQLQPQNSFQVRARMHSQDLSLRRLQHATAGFAQYIVEKYAISTPDSHTPLTCPVFGMCLTLRRQTIAVRLAFPRHCVCTYARSRCIE